MKKTKTKTEPVDPLIDVFGLDKSRYKQKTEKEYETYIRGLSAFELERHANSLGILPSPRASREVLIERLKRKFSSDRISLPIKNPQENQIASLSPEDEEELRKYFQRKR
jgi:hypothetical protein